MGNCTYNFFPPAFLPSEFFSVFSLNAARFPRVLGMYAATVIVSGYTWRSPGPRTCVYACICSRWKGVRAHVCACVYVCVYALRGARDGWEAKVHGLSSLTNVPRTHLRVGRPLSEYFLGSFLRTLTLSRTTSRRGEGGNSLRSW